MNTPICSSLPVTRAHSRLRNLLPVTAVLMLAFASASETPARTWRITMDGTGDAPSIEAAMDSTAIGDTILVAPGGYVIRGMFVANGVRLLSEEGPLQTRIVHDPNDGTPGGFSCGHLSQTTEISGFWIDGFDEGSSTGSGVVRVISCFRVEMRNNLFTNNSYSAVQILESFALLENNTFVNNTFAIDTFGSDGFLIANILWDESVGILSLALICNNVLDMHPNWEGANFSLDPMFCDPGDYRLQAQSPCAPGNSPLGDICVEAGTGDLVGALPVGCGSTPVEHRSWGQMKSMYGK